MNLGILADRKTLFTVAITALATSGALWLVQTKAVNLMCPSVQKQTGSFGIMIPGYRSWTRGNERDHSIDGSEGGEDIFGGGGNDKIRAFGGDDFVYGESGDDTLEAGLGRDVVIGGLGNDTIIGIDNHEIIDGGAGDDTLILPYKCRKFGIEYRELETKVLWSKCDIARVTLISVEHITVQPAPMQGPPPKPKPRHGGTSTLF
jgi:RTX calcium-binding nonapeptide repeat (4 copies)